MNPRGQVHDRIAAPQGRLPIRRRPNLTNYEFTLQTRYTSHRRNNEMPRYGQLVAQGTADETGGTS
jgi:hypothetical protein